MPKPKNREELLEQAKSNFERLMDLLAGIPKDVLDTDFPPGTMNRNERDVLAHLHQWHLMMLQWYRVGMKGGKPGMPAPGFTWKDTPALNRQIWEDCQKDDLASTRRRLRDSYRKVYKLIESHSDEELFTKKRYPWTGSTSLGAYLISNTSSHYDWAWKLIRKKRKH